MGPKPAAVARIGIRACLETDGLRRRPSQDMNRRYAYRDYEILVSVQPAGSQPGWRPEICVIAPDDHWQFVPTHHSLVANDPQYCLEIDRKSTRLNSSHRV